MNSDICIYYIYIYIYIYIHTTSGLVPYLYIFIYIYIYKWSFIYILLPVRGPSESEHSNTYWTGGQRSPRHAVQTPFRRRSDAVQTPLLQRRRRDATWSWFSAAEWHHQPQRAAGSTPRLMGHTLVTRQHHHHTHTRALTHTHVHTHQLQSVPGEHVTRWFPPDVLLVCTAGVSCSFSSTQRELGERRREERRPL